MALATTCPACKTSFKVNPDQLKLRKGLVRCGKCEHVFSGVDFLRYVRETKDQPTQEADKQTANAEPEVHEADALSPDTETVSEDLNTAFFLPETQMDTSEPAQAEAATAATPEEEVAEEDSGDSEPSETNSAQTRKQPRSKSARRNSRRRKRRRATDRDPDAPTPGIAAIEDRRQSGRRRADGASQENAKPAPPQISGNAQIASTHIATPAPGSEAQKQDMFDRQFGEAIDANRGVSDDASANERSGNESGDTDTGSQDFPDTLQANLPEAWQTTAIWPTYEEDMLAGELPADLPSEVGERGYRGKAQTSEKTPAEPQETADTAGSAAFAENATVGSAEGELARADQTNVQDQQEPAAIADSNLNTETTANVNATATVPETANPFEAALQSQPGTEQANQQRNEANEEDAIDFFGQTSKPVFDFDLPPRSVWLAAAGLTLLLCLQLAVGARDTLAAKFPPAKPLLELMASPLGLTVELPLDPEAITIESFDLISTGQSDYVMNMLMRNRADTSLRWPAIELTLTDSTGGILVRKALMPADYLKDNSVVTKGINANVEHIVKLQFNTDGINPSGYSAILFYY
jgi:predicted Zn finger-like uncharacterized protein